MSNGEHIVLVTASVIHPQSHLRTLSPSSAKQSDHLIILPRTWIA
jgi:hypothetical protein